MTACSMEREAKAPGFGCMPPAGPGGMHQMAKMCGRMMGKRVSGLVLAVPGVLLIIVGALIVIEPGILVWLLAAGSVLMGLMLLTMAGFVRRMRARPRE